jgi:hypothetical protein
MKCLLRISITLQLIISTSSFASFLQQLPPATQIGLHLYSSYSDRRLFGTTIEAEAPYSRGAAEWGIVHYNDKPRFPDDADTVSLAAWEAIVATLYGRQRMDPNQVRNARSKSSYDYRPVRRDHDRGRIGVEIAGAKHLFPTSMVSDACAIRVLSLMIADRLSNGPWEDYEVSTKAFTRPVIIYFNTIRQSLVASQELSLLKQKASYSKGSLDNIFIRTLGQDKDIPQNMRRKEKFAKGLTKGIVNPEQGIILVIQPTDFNDEFRPPGPSIDSVSHLQQLAARASVENLPIVVISPRFLVHQPHFGNNWEQSGFQQSSVFGGSEPARGPTPWILRDFFPPVFVWIGSAVSLARRGTSKDSERSSEVYSRVSMMQSVMNDCHAWHLYGAKEQNEKTSYQYLASTSTSAGRPTTDIIKTIFNEWSI